MARRGSGGLQSNPLASLLSDDEDREEQEVVAEAQAAGAVVRDLPVKSVAPDPENPLSRLQPDQELISSLKAEGQLQAGVVVPLDVWTSFGNDPNVLYRDRAESALADAEFADEKEAAQALAKAVDEAKAEIEYGINFGHRRWAGCVQAELDIFKAVVTDTIKDNTTRRVHRLIENYMRKSVTPLEEAEEFHRLTTEDKLGQREISRRTGIPQPYISKRLALRSLPEAARQALADKVIKVEVANELAKMADDKPRVNKAMDQITAYAIDGSTAEEKARQVEARDRFAADLVLRTRSSYDADKERAKLIKKLRAEGVTVLDDLKDYFSGKPHDKWKYQIHGDDNIKAARADGTALAYVYSRDQIEWYTTEEPPEADADAASITTGGDADVPEPEATEARGESIPAPRKRAAQTAAPAPNGETDEQRQRREEREREERESKAAEDARTASCLRIASKAPTRDQLTDRLARRVLMFEETYDYDAQQLAAAWLQQGGVVGPELSPHELFRADNGMDLKTLGRVAYTYDLALGESRLRRSAEPDSQDAEHIERLIKEAGYTPSPWEQQRLDALIAHAS